MDGSTDLLAYAKGSVSNASLLAKSSTSSAVTFPAGALDDDICHSDL